MCPCLMVTRFQQFICTTSPKLRSVQKTVLSLLAFHCSYFRGKCEIFELGLLLFQSTVDLLSKCFLKFFSTEEYCFLELKSLNNIFTGDSFS